MTRDAWIRYTNWRGETERRHIQPHVIWYGESPWHGGEQWLLGAWDLGRHAERTFALSGIRSWAATADGLPDDP
jgi:predicted DNA-binding transcriptional regulator YafY